jgi:hypothetical protein
MHDKRPTNACTPALCQETYSCVHTCPLLRDLLMRAHLPSAHATCARQVLQAPMCGCEFVAAASLHTSAYVSIRQHTSAYVSDAGASSWRPPCCCARDTAQHTSAYVSIRQHTSAYVSIRENTCCARDTAPSAQLAATPPR